jgi:O-succinylbenzoic acid--CoA ligase
MQITIHPDFRLNGKSFSDKKSLIQYVKKSNTDSYQFLETFLNESDYLFVNTSGSTGRSKKIRLSKRAMLHSAEATQRFFNLKAKTKALHCLSTDFIAGKMMWVRAIYAGWHIDTMATVSNPLKNNQKTYDFSAMVPLQVENSFSNLYQINKLLIGGAPISNDLEARLKSLNTAIYQTYGMTETITHIAVRKLTNKSERVYHTFPNVKLSVDSRDCLVIDAPLLVKDKIITNDVVTLINKNKFVWLGRFDNVINSGGVKLFPEQIEHKLTPYLSKAFIISSIADSLLGQRLVLIIESKQLVKDLNKIYSIAQLEKYEIPKEVFYVEKFYRTPNNKIVRNDIINNIYK